MIDRAKEAEKITKRHSNLSKTVATLYGKTTVNRLKQFKSTRIVFEKLDAKHASMVQTKIQQCLKTKKSAESEIKKMVHRKLGRAILKADELFELKMYLEEKSQEMSSPLVNMATAEKMIPHLPIKTLYEEGKVRGLKHKGKWYYCKIDLSIIVFEEKTIINRINQRVKMQHQKNRITLYKMITKIEDCRGQLHMLAHDKSIEKIVGKLDAIINEAHDFREKL